jgi:hypothetical protein
LLYVLWGNWQGSGAACFAVVQLAMKASAKTNTLVFMCVCVFDGLEMLFGYLFPGFGDFKAPLGLVPGVLPYFVVWAGLGDVAPVLIMFAPLFGLVVGLFVVVPNC